MLLEGSGVAALLAPARGDSCRVFCELARSNGWQVSVEREYNSRVTGRHVELLQNELYIPDKHFPILVLLRR